MGRVIESSCNVSVLAAACLRNRSMPHSKTMTHCLHWLISHAMPAALAEVETLLIGPTSWGLEVDLPCSWCQAVTEGQVPEDAPLQQEVQVSYDWHRRDTV